MAAALFCMKDTKKKLLKSKFLFQRRSGVIQTVPSGTCLYKGSLKNLKRYSSSKTLTFFSKVDNVRQKTSVRDHTLVYFLHKEDLLTPKQSFEVSHLCNNKGCLNPEHLVNESHEDNCRRRPCFKAKECRCLSKMKCIIDSPSQQHSPRQDPPHPNLPSTPPVAASTTTDDSARQECHVVGL